MSHPCQRSPSPISVMASPAFQSSISLSRHPQRHKRATISPRRPRLTAKTPASASPFPPTAPNKNQHPLTPSPELSAPLFRTLYSIIRGSTPPSEILHLSNKLSWHTPIFDLSDAEIGNTLTSFLSFAIKPTLSITSINTSETTFSWTLSFTYPLPWRPRVTIAASSTTDSFENPTVVRDQWFVHPVSLVRQALPRAVDLIWLYPGPHAETDTGVRRVLYKKGSLTVERFAAAPEVRVVGSVKDCERQLMFATPSLPEQAFEGGLRRREKYSAVSPLSVREIGDAVEWAIRVPGEFRGSAEVLLPVPNGEHVQIVEVEERICLVDRFGGVAMRDIVETRIAKMRKVLKAWDVEVERDRIWVRSYESKVGFNEKGLLAIAMYGSSKGVPRRNEIVMDVTGLVEEDFWKR